jgi:hypothetical protein
MQPMFPDVKRDGLAHVFKCVACCIIETITELREVPLKKAG